MLQIKSLFIKPQTEEVKIEYIIESDEDIIVLQTILRSLVESHLSSEIIFGMSAVFKPEIEDLGYKKNKLSTLHYEKGVIENTYRMAKK